MRTEIINCVNSTRGRPARPPRRKRIECLRFAGGPSTPRVSSVLPVGINSFMQEVELARALLTECQTVTGVFYDHVRFEP